MYESYYGFRIKPFQIIPDPNFLYLSPNHNHALQYLEYGIEHNIGIILLSGEVGSGKTTLIQYLRRQIDQNIELVVLSNTNLMADQLLIYILMELNIEPDENSKAHNLTLFKNYLQSLKDEFRRLILILDESQNLPKDALEEIRMLSNFQADNGLPLQIFLVGQPEIRTILKSPGMSQIRQRIAVNYHLNGLNQEETMHYIQYRLKIAGATQNPFSLEAVKMIHKATTGIPRTINILCDSALLYGFAEESETIDEKIISSVLKELNLNTFVQKEHEEQRASPDLSFSPSHKGGEGAEIILKPSAQVDQLPGPPPHPRAYAHVDERSETNVLLKKSYAALKHRLDKIEIKMDFLRDEIVKTANEYLVKERQRTEDLLVENTRIKSLLERLESDTRRFDNSSEEKVRQFDDETDFSGKSQRLEHDGKIYKLDK